MKYSTPFDIYYQFEEPILSRKPRLRFFPCYATTYLEWVTHTQPNHKYIIHLNDIWLKV